ncbi:hypothetical protein GCM10023210_10010 [Chryseobacterium ginsengisoli]|uniref:Uncharacterized protein n=1 Tax=Chryseobacterium ginsengisoli TaxID=363853 RepID=A0ABN0VMC0_9FLAO
MIASALIISDIAFSQVGVNITSRKTIMGANAKKDAGKTITDNTKVSGLQTPTLNQLKV